MTKSNRILVLAAATAGMLAITAPASAAPLVTPVRAPSVATVFGTAPSADAWNDAADSWNNSRRHYNSYDRYGYRDRPYRGSGYYDEPVYRDANVWRGRDGRTYCRKRDGTVGLIIGGAVGALLGREIDGGYDRATGTIIGGAAGALLGRSIARDGGRCR